MKKLSELYLMVENLQQADKIYFKTGRLSPMVRKIMIDKVTGGDALTKMMSDLYWGELQQDHRQGDWALSAIDKNHKYDEEKIYKSDDDYKDIDRWKKIKKSYQELKDYNKNVFPVIDYKEGDVGSLVQFNTALKHRRSILDMFEQLPKIAKRNMKADIRQPRDYSEMNKYRSSLEYFIGLYSQLNNRDEELKQNIIRKMFKSNTTLKDLLDFAEEKENLIGGADLTKDVINKIINEHYLEVVHKSGDKLVLEVTDVDAIKELGCNSLWCFTYSRRDGGANYQDWGSYSTNSIVYVFIDFSVSSDDNDFMYVLVEPLNFFPKTEEEEEENDRKLFSMDNNEVYGPLSVIDYFMGLDKGRIKLNFDMDPQPKPKEPKVKDPNQMELQFESRLRKLYEEANKLSYFGQCDKIRSLSNKNEALWHQMMKNKKPINVQTLINNVDFSQILDDDESPEEWLKHSIMSDPESGAYKSNWGKEFVLFFQTAGFEFIFK